MARSRQQAATAEATQAPDRPKPGTQYRDDTRGAATLGHVAKRDPHDVLGVARGASPSTIKAAWRRLARQHHPDLTGDDPAASRVATRLMAEINDAYAALTREGRNGRSPGSYGGGVEFEQAPPRRGGPPRPKPARPVTGRVDSTIPRVEIQQQQCTGVIDGQPVIFFPPVYLLEPGPDGNSLIGTFGSPEQNYVVTLTRQ